jgi:hypothetical protein
MPKCEVEGNNAENKNRPMAKDRINAIATHVMDDLFWSFIFFTPFSLTCLHGTSSYRYVNGQWVKIL